MEKSLFWYTNGFTGDTGDGAAPYTQEEFRLFNHAWMAKNQADVGVFPGALNELAVSGSASPLSVATGRASVYGFQYWADSAVSLSVSTPGVGTTGGRVVLRADWTAQTVRAAVILNTDGVATIPSMTQSAGSVWDIPLATFTITTGGVIALTDAREWILTGSLAKTFFVPCTGVENVTDGTTYDSYELGPEMTDAKQTYARGNFIVPSDFSSDMSISAVVYPSATGNVYARNNVYYGAIGEAWNNHTDSNGSHAAVGVTQYEREEILSLSLSSVAVGDHVLLEFDRNATSALDTINTDLSVLGWLVTYTAAQ